MTESLSISPAPGSTEHRMRYAQLDALYTNTTSGTVLSIFGAAGLWFFAAPQERGYFSYLILMMFGLLALRVVLLRIYRRTTTPNFRLWLIGTCVITALNGSAWAVTLGWAAQTGNIALTMLAVAIILAGVTTIVTSVVYPIAYWSFEIPAVFGGGIAMLLSGNPDVYPMGILALIYCPLLSIVGLGLSKRLNLAFKLAIENSEMAREVAETAEKLQEANLELERLSQTDALTGLANRRQYQSQLHKNWVRAMRDKHAVALLCIDVDDFKSFNDTYGHVAGDQCLQHVAHILQHVIREGSDLAVRLGGDEFALLLPGCDATIAQRVAERVIQGMAQYGPGNSPGLPRAVTLSIGIATALPYTGASLDTMLAEADGALYRAKSLGRNRYCIGNIPA